MLSNADRIKTSKAKIRRARLGKGDALSLPSPRAFLHFLLLNDLGAWNWLSVTTLLKLKICAVANEILHHSDLVGRAYFQSGEIFSSKLFNCC